MYAARALRCTDPAKGPFYWVPHGAGLGLPLWPDSSRTGHVSEPIVQSEYMAGPALRLCLYLLGLAFEEAKIPLEGSHPDPAVSHPVSVGCTSYFAEFQPDNADIAEETLL
jgi:hypothetical protein